MSGVSASPPREPDPMAKTRALSLLRQSVWQATQYLSYDEVRGFVEAVLREVERDEP